jgi:hypothetical protein
MKYGRCSDGRQLDMSVGMCTGEGRYIAGITERVVCTRIVWNVVQDVAN